MASKLKLFYLSVHEVQLMLHPKHQTTEFLFPRPKTDQTVTSLLMGEEEQMSVIYKKKKQNTNLSDRVL